MARKRNITNKIHKKWRIHPGTKIEKVKTEYDRNQSKREFQETLAEGYEQEEFNSEEWIDADIW